MENAVLVVAAAIVDDLAEPGALLAARRCRPAHLVGRWEFPGGKVDAGETPEEALHREIREELGVRVELGQEIVGPDDGGWIITDRHVLRLWFAQVVDGQPIPLIEHDALRWLTSDELWDVPWLDGDVRIVEHIEPSLTAAARGQGPSSTPSSSTTTSGVDDARWTVSPARTR